jgi:hypothetical protein
LQFSEINYNWTFKLKFQYFLCFNNFNSCNNFIISWTAFSYLETGLNQSCFNIILLELSKNWAQNKFSVRMLPIISWLVFKWKLYSDHFGWLPVTIPFLDSNWPFEYQTSSVFGRSL